MNLQTYSPQNPWDKRHLLKLADYSADEINTLLSLALKLKAQQKHGEPHHLLAGKTLGMIFAKSSTRTRVSFEVGMYQLGGQALFLSTQDIQLGRSETIHDTAQVLSRYVDGIMIRTFAQSDVEDLARYGSIPIINGLTDLYHPCQILADLMTLYEQKGTLRGLKLAYIGDGNNVANSLAIGCAKVGMDVAIASPAGYELDTDIAAQACAIAEQAGSTVLLCRDPRQAVAGADAVYTDVWASMGQEAQAQARIAAFAGYQVSESLFALADPEAVFLHCLPAHRGEEVAAAVIDGSRSIVFDQAENRLHAQKAVLALLMGGAQA